MAPLITIITPSYNRAPFIERAIESVLGQDYPLIEHIVMDGGSTDGTAALMRKYPRIRFFSGPDQGMYDALNKGMERATGEIIGFLNTDDQYEAGVFRNVAESFADNTVMAVAGRALVVKTLAGEESLVMEEYLPDKNSLLEDCTTGGSYFNAWFFRRSVFEKIGKFNAAYRIIGDRDFMLRLALSGLKYMTINRMTYRYYQHVDSMTFDKSGRKIEQSASEHLDMTSHYLQNHPLSKQEKRLLVQFQTRDTVELAVRNLARLNLKGFAYYSFRGARYDPRWVWEFLKFVLGSMFRALSKFRRPTPVSAK